MARPRGKALTSVSYRIPPELYDAIRQVAEMKGLSINAIVIEMLQAALAHKRFRLHEDDNAEKERET